MHRPERWGYLLFSRAGVGEIQPQFVMPYVEKQKQYLWLVYYKQQNYRREHRRYAISLSELDIENPDINIDGKKNMLELSAIGRRYEALIKDESDKGVYINEEGLIYKYYETY
jgi:hypothetical protein